MGIPQPASRVYSDEYQGNYAGLSGASARMQKAYHLIAKVAVTRDPVLILGESGTGKELVAHAIHAKGPWGNQPFVPIDCGALTPTLIESEMFGHVRGAFTGATHDRQGLLAAAGEGTVFLDEIVELPVELQSKLLRALQEREIKPLGSNERIQVKARIVAATNRTLRSLSSAALSEKSCISGSMLFPSSCRHSASAERIFPVWFDSFSRSIKLTWAASGVFRTRPWRAC